MILVAAVGILIGMGAFVWHLKEQRGRYDPDTFCPLDGSEAHTAILIDASDPLSATQVKRVIEYLDDLRRHLAQYEWVGLYVLDADDALLAQPTFSLCNPGDAAHANPLYENPERIRRQFEQKFREPLARAVEEMTASNSPKQATSPILEMIRSVATDRRFRFSGRRKLVIVSDMLQNMPAYTQYSGDVDFASFKRNPYSEQFLNMSLLDVEVEIIYLKRSDTTGLQTHAHVRFWEEYFDSVDATLNRVEPVL